MSTSEKFIEPVIQRHHDSVVVIAGDIVDRVTEKVLYPSFPKSVVYSVEDTEFLKNIDIAKFRVFECVDGTLVRAFCHKGTWHTAIHYKVDKKPRISIDGLDSSKMYIFMQPDNVFLATSTNEGGIVHATDTDELPHLTRRKELKFDSIDAAVEYVRTDDNEQGIILINADSAIRIMTNEYLLKREIRGKSNSLRFRYLEIRSRMYTSLPLFFELYPEMVDEAEDIEESIYALAKYLHALYMRVYIKNDTTLKLSKDERVVLNMVHRLYTTTKQRTIPSRVNDVLATVHPSRLNRLLARINNSIE